MSCHKAYRKYEYTSKFRAFEERIGTTVRKAQRTTADVYHARRLDTIARDRAISRGVAPITDILLVKMIVSL